MAGVLTKPNRTYALLPNHRASTKNINLTANGTF